MAGVKRLLVPKWLGEALSAVVCRPHQAERPQGPDVLVRRRESLKGSRTFPTRGFFDFVIAADRISFPMLFKVVIRLGGQGYKSVHTQSILMNSLEKERGKWYCLFCFSEDGGRDIWEVDKIPKGSGECSWPLPTNPLKHPLHQPAEPPTSPLLRHSVPRTESSLLLSHPFVCFWL